MTEENPKIAIIDVAQIVNRKLKTTYTTRDMFTFAANGDLRLLCYAPKLPLRIPNYQETCSCSYFSPDNDTVIRYPGKYFNPSNTNSGNQYLRDLAECRESVGILEIYADPHIGLTASDYEQYSNDELSTLDDLDGNYKVMLYQKKHPPEVLPYNLQPTVFDILKGHDPEDWGYQVVGFKPNSNDFFVEQWWLEYFINEKEKLLNSITIGKQTKPRVPKTWKPQNFGLPEIFSILEPDSNYWKKKGVTPRKRSQYIGWQIQILNPANANKNHGTVCEEIAKSEYKVKKGTVVASTYSIKAIEKAGRLNEKT